MDEPLPHIIWKLLADRGMTLSTAESCTGGKLAEWITSVPGSSRYYLGGYVTYSDDAKIRDLHVPPAWIEEFGAVSEPVAGAMAEGAMLRTGSDYTLAITGIAGPDGESVEKPVGMVWIALAAPGEKTTTQRCKFGGDRAAIRETAARAALELLRARLLDS